MRGYLALVVLLIGCGGSTDNGTATTGTGGLSGSGTVGNVTGGRSYISVPAAGGDLGVGGLYQIQTGVNVSNGGAGNSGGAHVTGGAHSGGSPVTGGTTSATGGSATTGGFAATGGSSACVPWTCEQYCPTHYCGSTSDPVKYAIQCPVPDGCNDVIVCYCVPA
jgi:hypothetical protein